MILSTTAHAQTQPGVELALSSAASQSFGMPSERLARVAARRAFVEMKLRFMQAAMDVPGAPGESLVAKVRSSSQAVELWRLRDELFDALDCGGQRQQLHQQEIGRQLSQVFQF
jgi:predicted HNH restriction endonuclease